MKSLLNELINELEQRVRDRECFEEVIDRWIFEFCDEFEDVEFEVGDYATENTPLNVRFAFDGYSENDDDNDDENEMSFALYVRKDALNEEEFPDHESTFGAVKHRQDEEALVFVWYNTEDDSKSIIFDELGPFDSEDEVRDMVVNIERAFKGS